MKTSKKAEKIKVTKSALTSSTKSKGKYCVDDLETDKESRISDYDEDY